MTLNLLVSEIAQQEAADAQRYLEGLSTHAGPRFRRELERCFQFIAQHPRGFQVRHRQFRYAPLAVFPYHVIYSVGEHYIVVHRIRHMHQRPLKRYSKG